MARKPASGSIEERATASWLDDAEKVAQRVAADEGPPPGAKKLSDAEAVKQWGIRDPFVDDSTPQMLLTRGIPQEALQQTAFWQELGADQQDAWAQLLTQPTQDAEMADTLSRILEYPFRYGLVTDWSDDPEEQTKRAESLQRQWEKTWPEATGAVQSMGGATDGGNDAQQPAQRPRPEDQAAAMGVAQPDPSLPLQGGGLPQGVGQPTGVQA